MHISSEDNTTGYLNGLYPLNTNLERIDYIQLAFSSIIQRINESDREKCYDIFKLLRGMAVENSIEVRYKGIKPSAIKKMMINPVHAPIDSFKQLADSKFIIVPSGSEPLFKNTFSVDTYSFDMVEAMNKLDPKYESYVELMFHNNLYTFAVYSYGAELMRMLLSMFRSTDKWNNTDNPSKFRNDSDTLKSLGFDFYASMVKNRSNMIQHLFSSAILSRKQENIDLVMKYMAAEYYISDSDIEYSMDNNFAEMRNGKSVGMRHNDHSTVMLKEIKSYYNT